MMRFAAEVRAQQPAAAPPPADPELINLHHHIEHHIQPKTRAEVGQYIEAIHSLHTSKPSGEDVIAATLDCYQTIITKGNETGDGVPLFIMNAGDRL